MKRHTNHEFNSYFPATMGNSLPCILGGKPPMNEVVTSVVAIVGVLASATSAYISYDTSQKQAEQSKLNAEAQAAALRAEADRKALEDQENQRRLAMTQKRQRQLQLAAIGQSGIQAGTGTALTLESDMYIAQQTELNDASYINRLNQEQLEYKAGTVLAMGAQEASQYKQQGTAAIISGIGNTAQAAGSLNFKSNKKTSPVYSTAPTGTVLSQAGTSGK